MQIKISFNSEKDIILPIHYNGIMQAFIYNNIDNELATFLHEEGYTNNNRSFKLFTFSRILNRGKKIGNKFNFGKRIDLVISSPLESFGRSIAKSMIQQDNLFLAQNEVKVGEIQIVNNVIENESVIIETLSSIVAYSTLLKPDGGKYTLYFTPSERDFNRIISENIVRKYNALNNTELSFENTIEILPMGTIKQNATYYKDFLIKGVSGKFVVKGKKELIQLGVDAGFGSKNSQGFGCVKVL